VRSVSAIPCDVLGRRVQTKYTFPPPPGAAWGVGGVGFEGGGGGGAGGGGGGGGGNGMKIDQDGGTGTRGYRSQSERRFSYTPGGEET